MTEAPYARPYVITRGRTTTHQRLYTHTLIIAPRFNPVHAASLIPESRALYERAAGGPESIAELSAHCDVPLGLARVLISDLAKTGDLVINPEHYDSPFHPDLLEKILDGLARL